MSEVDQFLHGWDPEPDAGLRSVGIEDDSLREGAQSAFVVMPSTAEKIELIDLSIAVGTQAAMLGFPASSVQEHDDCRAILAHLKRRDFPLAPYFLARARVSDAERIVRLRDEFGPAVHAAFYIGTSPLRRHVEGWSFEALLRQVDETAAYLARADTRSSLALEDASRTPPEDLDAVIATGARHGVNVFCVCDTAGDCRPEGAERLVQFVRSRLLHHGSSAEVWWHGHNDGGLSLANALAAAHAGASTISGVFIGFGERAGNTPLEQLVYHLVRAGSTRFHLDRVLPYCRRLSEHMGMAIPANAPLVGSHVFSTGTGTHTAAVLKARGIGPRFEDLVFSGVEAALVGRRQEILIGPLSGRENARFMLEQLGLAQDPDAVQRLLDHAKSARTWLDAEQVRAWSRREVS